MCPVVILCFNSVFAIIVVLYQPMYSRCCCCRCSCCCYRLYIPSSRTIQDSNSIPGHSFCNIVILSKVRSLRNHLREGALRTNLINTCCDTGNVRQKKQYRAFRIDNRSKSLLHFWKMNWSPL